ncbi:MAG TPA: ParB N-terminal domain-containing protein [Kofleriaceae bacterium]|nr:ParB N-terminal domain-containing protein [Kofleriaceae bacterium]
MEIDLHRLELRHRDLRIVDVDRRRRLIGSIAEIGQQVPAVVIADSDRFVLIDGYLRVEALTKLQRDTVLATTWSVSEVEALLHHRHLAITRRSALEDAWLLARLRDHGLTMDELARRLCRSKSWVSHRLGLLDALAVAVHDRVRAGTVPPHGAMRYLVPFARANRRQCEQLLARLGDARVSDRDLAALYTGWKRADREGKQRIVDAPLLFLQALASSKTTAPVDDEASLLLKDLTMLAAIAGRANRRVREAGPWTAALTRAFGAASEAFAALGATIEEMHARPDHPTSHPDPS